MADVFDYLAWRGELTLAQSPFNCVDALILSVLAYMSFGDAAPGGEAVELGTTAQALLARGEGEPGARNGTDRRLLEALAGSARFCGMRLLACEECVDPRREMQFGAFTALTGDGAVFVAYRGTDNTLVGWKEDLNMSFAPVVAGQRRAVQYLERAAGMAPGPLRLGGHSKGGNLAVYAGAFCAPETQARIEAVFNNDGPGFAPEVLEAGGYRNILPRVQAFVPQTSIVGMLMGHGDDYTVVRSDQVGIMQHDPYTWQVLGPDFVRLEQVTAGSRLVDRALKDWLAGLTREERERFVDAVFGVLEATGAVTVRQLVDPHNARVLVRAMTGVDEKTRAMLLRVLSALASSAGRAVRQAAAPGHRLRPETGDGAALPGGAAGQQEPAKPG